MNNNTKEKIKDLPIYIKNNLEVTNDSKKAIDELVKLINYLYSDDNKINLSLDAYNTILKKSPLLINLISVIVKPYGNKIKESNIENISCNSRATEMIEAYCIINNIIEEELNEKENEYDLSSKDISSMSIYLNQIGKIPLLSKEEAHDLLIKIAQGDKTAKNEFLEHNLRLVIKIAKKYFTYSCCNAIFMDIIQEGNCGLSRAIDKFDLNRGYQFSTYATWWIKQSIKRFLVNNLRTVRVPVYVNDIKAKIDGEEAKLRNLYDREPTLEEIAKVMNMKVSDVARYYNLPDPVSIDVPVEGDDKENSTFADFIPSNMPLTDDEAIKSTLNDDIRKMLSVLKNDRQRNIIILRFGLDGRGIRKLEECGAIYHVTRERARQIEADALKIMRKSAYIKGYEDYTDNPTRALAYINEANTKKKKKRQYQPCNNE